jgi:hypothetical protein
MMLHTIMNPFKLLLLLLLLLPLPCLHTDAGDK